MKSIVTVTALLHLAAFLAVHVLGQTGDGPDGCFTNLDDISNTEVDLLKLEDSVERDVALSKLRTYILCDETSFFVGNSDGKDADAETLSYDGGSMPLVILNPNMLVQCGKDGKSSNNCIIQGGEHQVIAPSRSTLPTALENVPNEPNASNFTLRGVTMEDSTELSLSMTSMGQNIMIEDCVFRGQISGDFVVYLDASSTETSGVGSVKSSTNQTEIVSPSGRSRRRRNLLFENDKKDRDLEDGANSPTDTEDLLAPGNARKALLSITFKKCLFVENRVLFSVLATVKDVHLRLENTQFIRNAIPERNDGLGSVVWTTDGTGTIRNNCFRENSFSLTSTLVNGGDFVLESNFGQDKVRPQDVGCDHVMFVPPTTTLGEVMQGDSDYTCHDFERDSCGAAEGNSPTSGSLPFSYDYYHGFSPVLAAIFVGVLMLATPLLC